jgi:hypothetical protein
MYVPIYRSYTYVVNEVLKQFISSAVCLKPGLDAGIVYVLLGSRTCHSYALVFLNSNL